MPATPIAEGVVRPAEVSLVPSISVRIRPGWLSALIVTVGLASALVAGLVYSYLRKDITVVVGPRIVHVTTFKRTVGQALEQAGVAPGAGDEVSAPLWSRLAKGQKVVIRRAVPVSITVDGKMVKMNSAAASVGDLLRRRGVMLGESDKVFPSVDAPLAANVSVRVIRIAHTVLVEQLEVPYRVQTSQDSQVPRGLIRVRAPGRVGLKERMFKLTLADNVVVGRQLVGERVVRNPLDRVITVGTQVQIASRGEFAGHEMIEMLATAYSPWCCRGVDDVTALGLRAGYGVVAVDPTIIPLGSRLYVEGYGYAIAGDTGSAIKGMRIDLGFNTIGEAIRFGRRPVRVYVVRKYEKPPKAKKG